MKKYLLAAFLLTGINISFADNSLPHRFLDLTNTLSSSEADNVEDKLNDFYSNNKMELEIILVESTDGTPINKLSTKLFNDYKIGNNPQNNGLLILISKNDRQFSIKPGLGIADSFKQNVTNQYGNDCFKPNFRVNDYVAGINCAINKTNNIVNEPISDPVNIKNEEKNEDSLYSLGIYFLISMGIFLFYKMMSLILNKPANKTIKVNSNNIFRDLYDDNRSQEEKDGIRKNNEEIEKNIKNIKTKKYYPQYSQNIHQNNSGGTAGNDDLLNAAIIYSMINSENNASDSNYSSYSSSSDDSSSSSSDFGSTSDDSGGSGSW